MTILEELINYSNNCINNTIISCEKHKQACKRFLKDIDKCQNTDWLYYWDENEAEKIVYFFTLLRHSKGILAGTPIYLTTWQKFVLCQLFGWRRKDNSFRRFKKSFIEVARKNAKSQMESGVCLYTISYESQIRGEVIETYCAGVKRKQSLIIFDECKLMLNKSPIRDRFNITKTRITYKKNGSYLEALNKEDGKKGDGSNPGLLILDEYHQHPSSEFMALGIGANTKSNMLMVITTAGKDLTYPCFTEEYKNCSDILDENVDIENDIYFIDILELDEDDDINNEENWKKSNPIRMTYLEGVEKIREEYITATQIPEKMTDFLTKALNVWVMQKKDSYMNMKVWKKCEVKELPISILGRKVYLGMDLSCINDLTSLSFIIPFWNFKKECMQYIVFTHSFIPNLDILRAKELTDRVPYTSWARQGYISVLDTPEIDQAKVVEWAKNYIKKYDLQVQKWGYDPYNASKIATDLADEFEMWSITQSHKNLNETTVAFRQAVLDENVFYLPNPVMNFAMKNAVLSKINNLIKIDKDANKFKIDPIDATICAFKPAYFYFKKEDEIKVDIEDLIDQLNI